MPSVLPSTSPKATSIPELIPKVTRSTPIFWGVGAGDYTLQIAIVQAIGNHIDNENDRTYHVQANEGKTENSENGIHYTLAGNQIFRKGLYQDSVSDYGACLGALDTEHDYRISLELVPGETLDAGIPQYQYVVIDFMKNLNTMPDFRANDGKLADDTLPPQEMRKFSLK